MEIIVLAVILLAIGALLGGKNFGDSFRKGCGCMTITIFILAIILVIIFAISKGKI